MLKKITGYVVMGAVAVAVLVLVYLFITKGYSGKGTTTLPYVQTTAPGASPVASQEAGTVTSDKISLIITSPKDGDVLGSTNAAVKGKTASGAEVFVNDQEGSADANGNFSISIGLDEGENKIVVSVNDGEGNVAEQELNVVVSSFE
ncbi:MAG: hypothetical protein NTZ07_02675 [Candidatus Woesebacteria bacterium]|nr:hypothetical protein [Candidatus Woesebacteria bacterium]